MKTQLQEVDERNEAHAILSRACLHLVQQFRYLAGDDSYANIKARKYLIECMDNLVNEAVDHLRAVKP